MSPARPSPATSRVRMSFIVESPRRRRVGQQRHLAGVLDGLGDLALLLGAHPGDPASPDLAAVGDELPQQGGVLVVDVADLGRGERILLLLGLANRWFWHVCLLEGGLVGATGGRGRTPRGVGRGGAPPTPPPPAPGAPAPPRRWTPVGAGGPRPGRGPRPARPAARPLRRAW